MGEVKRVLFVSSEIYPYLPESPIGRIGRFLPQGVQERKREIRSFMPRYGCINERKNQLHEVIRLSGMNIVISEIDRPLVIKVASISSARMQVYFIDNDDYFHRKQIYCDENGKFFEDNGERAIFFARGVLETVKKLRWAPDVIHCHGWISHILPLYLKSLARLRSEFQVVVVDRIEDYRAELRRVDLSIGKDGLVGGDVHYLAPEDVGLRIIRAHPALQGHRQFLDKWSIDELGLHGVESGPCELVRNLVARYESDVVAGSYLVRRREAHGERSPLQEVLRGLVGVAD